MSSTKSNFLETEKLSSSGSLNLCNGYLFLGESQEERQNTNELPKFSYTGTSETKGNISRDLYNINTNGPVLFGSTQDDKRIQIENFIDQVTTNPILSSFPWLYPQQENWTQDTQVSLDSSETFPIYKCLGKGLGEIEFFKVGSPIQGTEEKQGKASVDVNGKTCGVHPKTNMQYPFNGKIYAGTLVEIITEEKENGIKETKVIPYQKGRGIPPYSNSFQPSNVSTLGTFLPFGELKWPTSNQTIEPSLAVGIEPGESNKVVGIALDTFTSTIPDNRIFKYETPSNASNFNEPWYNHPAPFTVPATSVSNNSTTPKTQGFLSPGPNLSGGYWSPWPDYYTYKTDEAIPILTKGITTARIGAAYNIALTTYGIKKKISATDESWIPVTSIPLFQGERLEAGSYIYASVKGHCCTPGPLVPNYYNEADPNDTSPIGIIGQTPWDLFIDSTWGNIGWTGTPGLSFSTIPDSGVSIAETLKNSSGEVKTIPYLNQSNQGSIIVHPISAIQPTPATGNAYGTRRSQQSFIVNQVSEIQEIYKNRTALRGISGRCMLPQPSPEKCQPIGILLETIEGKGKWNYTGIPDFSTIDFNEFTQIRTTTGGVSYVQSGTTVPVRGGTGSNMEVSWTENISLSPNLGTINQLPTITAAGVGYVDGDIVTVQDNTLTYNTTPQYKSNNASYVFNAGQLEFTTGGGGSNYDAAGTSPGITFNSSRNNVYLYFGTAGTGQLTTGTLNVGSTHFQDFSKYPIGTILRILDDNVLEQDQAIVEVTGTMNYTSKNISILNAGDTYPLLSERVYEHEVINWNFRQPIVTSNISSGTIQSSAILSYGAGNTKGDLIILTQPVSDRNAVIAYPGILPGNQEITHAVPWYSTLVLPTQRAGTTTDDGLIVDLVKIDSLRESEYSEKVAIMAKVNTLGAPVADTVYEVIVGPPPGTQYVPSPLYTSRKFSVLYTAAGELKVHAGGSNYTSATNVSCYNLTANSLRLRYTVTDGIVTAKVIGDPFGDDWGYISSRYTFDQTNGTELKLLDSNVPPGFETIVRLVSEGGPNGIETETVQPGGYYNTLANGDWMFQTQRTDQTNPTVRIITAQSSPDFRDTTVYDIEMINPGVGNKDGDLILVTQEGSDNNCVFIYKDNRIFVDVPPFGSDSLFRVDTSEEAWEKYSNIMSSTVNLLDKQVLVELRPNSGNTMENVYPNGVINWFNTPSTNNLYETFY